MTVKYCRNCGLAQKVDVEATKVEGRVVFSLNGMVLNDTTTSEESKGTLFQRSCSRGMGTETVEPHDKCISKLEFRRRLPG